MKRLLCLCLAILHLSISNSQRTLRQKRCSPQQFQCIRARLCMPFAYVCDGDRDCATENPEDGSDEYACAYTGSNCSVPNHVKCIGSKQCVPDYYSCDGENDCFVGSDELSCSPEDRRKATDNFLLVADNGNTTAGLYQVELLTGRVKQLMKEKISSTNAIAFDSIRKDVYFSDLELKTIEKYSFATGEVTRIHDGSADGSLYDGLTVDAERGKLYYANQRLIIIQVPDPAAGNGSTRLVTHPLDGQIGEISLDGSSHRVVITKAGSKPRAIQIDAETRMVYWSDWGAIPAIFQISVEPGSTESALIVGDLMWPNALTIDFKQRVMYWADVNSDTFSKVETANLDGTGRRTLFEELNVHYFGMCLDATYVYMTDWNSRSIRRIDRATGERSIHANNTFGRLSGIALYNSSLSPEASTTSTSRTFISHTWTVTQSTVKLMEASEPRQAITPYQRNNPTVEPKEPSTPADPSTSSTDWLKDRMVVALAIGGAIIITAMIAVTLCCIFARRIKRASASDTTTTTRSNPPPATDTLLTRHPIYHPESNQYEYIPADAYSTRSIPKPVSQEHPYLQPQLSPGTYMHAPKDNDYLKPATQRVVAYTKIVDDL